MSMLKFFAVKAAALAVALSVLGALWFLAPEVILAGFDLNLVWIAEVWGRIYPLLPSEVSISLDVVERAYASLVTVVQTVTQLLPEVTARQVEAATRAVLGEGWILVVEIALPFRLYWMWLWWWR